MARSQFKKTVFNNGLTLLTERLTGFRSLSMGIWVKTGTRHEHPAIAGGSHFLEHMLFKGTKGRSALQIAREIDQVGGEFNAFTSREHTCFHLLLLDRDCHLGIDILGDVLLNSTFKNEEYERERKVILQEIAMVEESPEELAHDIYFERIYENHGLGRPILGTEASIKKMKRKDVIRFFQDQYRPEELVFSVAGDISHEEIKQKMRKWTHSKWPGRSARANQTRVEEPAPPVKKGAWWIERPTEQVHLIWGVPGLPYNSKDRFVGFLLNVYLGGGMSSTLFQEIREKHGLSYTVYSSLSPFIDSGVFSVYAATQLNQVSLCLKLIEKCIHQVKSKTLTTKELKLVKENLKGTILLSADNVESRMSNIARNEMVLGRFVSTDEVCKKIDAVTPSDFKRVANFLFHNQERSILALGPKPSAALMKRFQKSVSG